MIPTAWEPPQSGVASVGPAADVYSPDRSVRITASARGDVGVQVQGLQGHSEDSLARQVRAAARLALAYLQQPTQDVETPANERRFGW